MTKGSPPPSPDYAGAAKATAEGNLEAARYTTEANRINQYTPYGSIEYSKTQAPAFDQAGYDAALARYNQQLASQGGTQNQQVPNMPGMPIRNRQSSLTAPNMADFTTKNPSERWSVTTRLSPSQQRQFDVNNQINESLGGVAKQGLGYVQSALDQPLGAPMPLTSSAGDPQLLQKNVMDALYKNSTQYLDPQFSQSDKALEARLANQGITQGSEAYNAAMLNQSNARQQAYESARNAATSGAVGAAQGMFGQYMGNANLGNQVSAQDFAQRQAMQQNPINMLNAVRTGQQMNVATLPTPQNVAMQQGVAGPDLLGAASATGQYNQGIYNAQQAANTGMFGGLGQMAIAGAKLWR